MRKTTALAFALSACAPESEDPPEKLTLRVTLSNTSQPGALAGADVWFAPGIWAVHTDPGDVVARGDAASPGLEQLAEDGDPLALMAAFVQDDQVLVHGVFGTERPGENYDENPIEPGMSVDFDIVAMSNERLSLVSMFVQTNDVVLALTDLLLKDYEMAELEWLDAGTEANEPPGIGPNQPMQQEAPGAGIDENGVVGPIEDDFDYPDVDSVARLQIERL